MAQAFTGDAIFTNRQLQSPPNLRAPGSPWPDIFLALCFVSRSNGHRSKKWRRRKTNVGDAPRRSNERELVFDASRRARIDLPAGNIEKCRAIRE